MADRLNTTTQWYHVNVEDHVVITTLHEGASDVGAPPAPRAGRRRRSDAHERGTAPPRSVPADESSQKNWKRKLGEFMVQDVLVKELQRRNIRWPKEDIVQGRLTSFPEGYMLVSVPRLGDSQHNDLYLIPPHYPDDDRYRSPAEFGPHLAWLMTGQPRGANGRPTCDCCLCEKLRTGKRGKVDHTRYKNVPDYFSAPHKEAASSHRRQIRVSTPGPSRSSAQTIQDIASRAKDYRRYNDIPMDGDG